MRNTWRSGYDLGGWKTGYHGYWAQDFLDIDPRLTSRHSLEGIEYPDSAEGRMRHYQDFVQMAHSPCLDSVLDFSILLQRPPVPASPGWRVRQCPPT